MNIELVTVAVDEKEILRNLLRSTTMSFPNTTSAMSII